jgi:hypothetical protein
VTARSSRCPSVLALVLAALLWVSACGSDGNTPSASSGGDAGADSTTTGAVVDGSTPEPSAPESVGPDGSASTVAPSSVAPDPTTSMTDDGDSSNGVALDADVPAGRFAPAYLRPDLSSRLVVELSAQQGAEPRPATVDRLAGVLESVSGKPVSVDRSGLDGGARRWTADSLRAAADDVARTVQGSGTTVVRLLFVRGTFEDGGVLGVAVRGDVAAVFVDEVAAVASVLVPASTIEEAVTVHEIGHLLGLVDLYLGTGRGDPQHPGHSRNPESVMYWAVESTLVGQVLSGPPPRQFDEADLADLAAIRAGG